MSLFQLQLEDALDRGDSAAAERIIAAPGFNVNEQDEVSTLAHTCDLGGYRRKTKVVRACGPGSIFFRLKVIPLGSKGTLT